MTVEEIFGKISEHMIQGMMLHEQMCSYYDFLSLHGYKRCHEYHYFCETAEHRKIQRFFINRYNKLIPTSDIENHSVIPSSWYKYDRQSVDTSTKRNAIKTGFSVWISWETETRDLYTQLYEELEKSGEISAAEKVCDLIKKVDMEIKKAERKILDLESVGYDMVMIVESQHKIHEKYRRKLKKMMFDF